jgi:hypothetical protein
MNPILEMNTMGISFRSMIKLYMKRAQEIELYLSKRPKEWGKFQAEFNAELNNVFRNIMNFEKVNLINGREDRVYKLKRIFVKRFRKIFARGVYCDWSFRKPLGYAGDFKIIDDIYQNNPTTTGFDRLFDNYFQMSAISVAVRNRKEDFKRLIISFVCERQNYPLRIMNLASGSCRELKEIFTSDKSLFRNVTFDCYDNEERAIEYAKVLLGNSSKVNFIKLNAVRIALAKDVNRVIHKRYDLIYSAGLFDYFSDRIAIAVVRNLRKLLKSKGILAISNVRDKYSNPSVHFMEWAGDWNLVYRDDDAFRKIFIDAGFKEDELETQYEQQGIMQYIIAINK